MSNEEMDSEYDHRKSDKRIDELEENIKDLFNGHVEEYHAFKAEQLRTMVEEHKALIATTQRMAEMIDGEPVRNAHGELLGRSGGLYELALNNANTLSVIEERTNGGVSVSYNAKPEWSRSNKIAASMVGVMVFLGMMPSITWSIRQLAEWITTL